MITSAPTKKLMRTMLVLFALAGITVCTPGCKPVKVNHGIMRGLSRPISRQLYREQYREQRQIERIKFDLDRQRSW